jgi:hypothetical protein
VVAARRSQLAARARLTFFCWHSSIDRAGPAARIARVQRGRGSSGEL